jgi:DNA-binding MarR family transcriptional regulator
MSKQHYQAATYRARDSIGALLKRSHSLTLDISEPVLEAHGFSFIQYIILAWLRDGDVINPKMFCRQYRYDSGAMTRVIDQLAERGLVERARRGGDRRMIELELTPAGRAAVDGLIPLVVDKLNLALADFSTAEFEELKRLLIKLNSTLQALEPGAAQTSAVHTGAVHTGAVPTGAVQTGA